MKVRYKGTLTKAHSSDAAYDLYAAEDTAFEPHKPFLIRTDVVLDLPEGYVGLVCSRSGLALKGFQVYNAPGVIDAGFKAPIGVIGYVTHKGSLPNEAWLRTSCKEIECGGVTLITETEALTVPKGTKIAQLIIKKLDDIELEQVQEISTETDRGTKGFGSSGLV